MSQDANLAADSLPRSDRERLALDQNRSLPESTLLRGPQNDPARLALLIRRNQRTDARRLERTRRGLDNRKPRTSVFQIHRIEDHTELVRPVMLTSKTQLPGTLKRPAHIRAMPINLAARFA